MDNFKDQLNGNCTNCKNISLSTFDQFGDMLKFTIRRKAIYQTKVGGFCTILFILIVAGTFGYYFSRFMDKTKPMISVNEYLGDELLKADLIKDGYEYFFQPLNLGTGKILTWNEFWGSFHIAASIVEIGDGLKNNLGIPNFNWTPINLMECSKAKWLDKITDPHDRLYIAQGICFNSTSIQIFGGQSTTSRFITIDLYPCQKDSIVPCNNQVDKSGLRQILKSIEKPIRIDDYDNPIKFITTDRLYINPSNKLVFNDNIILQKTVLHTNRGVFIDSIVSESVLQQHSLRRTVGEYQTDPRIFGRSNIQSHGRSFSHDQ